MLSSLAAAGPAVHAALAHGPVVHGFGGLWWLGILIPLFWLLVFALLFGVFGRRWRRRAWESGSGFNSTGHHAPGRSAEATLAERFAQGDIDEKDYRARLEVLRANHPTSS